MDELSIAKDVIKEAAFNYYLRKKTGANNTLLGGAASLPSAIIHGVDKKNETYSKLIEANEKSAATPNYINNQSGYTNGPQSNPQGFLSAAIQALQGSDLDNTARPPVGNTEYLGSSLGQLGREGVKSVGKEIIPDLWEIVKDRYGLNPLSKRNDTASKMQFNALTSGASEFGKQLGAQAGSMVTGATERVIGGFKERSNNKLRNSLIGRLQTEDPIIKNIPPDKLQEAYATMVRFAPTLSTDPNAVRSFLREAGVSGGGISFPSIRILADAERSISDPGRRR